MIGKLLTPALEMAGKAIAKGATAAGKAIAGHFAKHGVKYLFGGGFVVAGGAGYAAGKHTGHEKGKKEGVAEQAFHDETKMKNMHQEHENDRKRWKEEKQAYEDLLNKIENQ